MLLLKSLKYAEISNSFSNRLKTELKVVRRTVCAHQVCTAKTADDLLKICSVSTNLFSTEETNRKSVRSQALNRNQLMSVVSVLPGSPSHAVTTQISHTTTCSRTRSRSRRSTHLNFNPGYARNPCVGNKLSLVGGVNTNFSSSFHTGSAFYSEHASDAGALASAANTAVGENSAETAANVTDGGETVFKSVFESQAEHMPVLPAEVPFNELGLGSAFPPGMAQIFMEMLHIDFGLPWWQVIGVTTICLRTLVFPIVIMAQRNMVILNNHKPQIEKLQIEQQMAQMRGETQKAMMLMKAQQKYFEEHGCHPGRSLFPLLFQGAFFMSMFFALRGMTNVPVPSLTAGGLHWFTDLTVADPFYLLPVLTSSTLFLQLYLGADGINASTMPPLMKKIFYAMPILSLPVMIQFPAALNLYWLCNNIISVVQASLIRLPAVREKLKIGEMIQWEPKDLPMNSFAEELKREIARQEKMAEKEKFDKHKEEFIRKEKEKERREKLLQALREEDEKIKSRGEK